MDPYYEQRLRDEVIYLHSLWRQGPPTPAAARHLLQPSKTAQFKKQKKRKGKKGNRVKELAAAAAAMSDSSPGAEWPCPTPLPPTEGWPNPESKPETKSRLPSREEQSKLAAKNAHLSAVQVVNEFFRSDDAGDSDGIENDSEGGDDLMPEDGWREYYSFFFKVFKDNAELREHYEKHFVGGEFNCLVCGAVGGKGTSKKFKGCLPLVHHSITVAKTKKRRAHRALGMVICKVLGWDIDQLPTIVSTLSKKFDEIEGNVIAGKASISVANLVDAVESKDDDVAGGGAKEALLESGLAGAGMVANGDEGNMNSVTCPDVDNDLHSSDAIDPGNGKKDFIMLPDADKTIEHQDTVQSDNVEVPAAEELASGFVMLADSDKTTEHDDKVQHDYVEVPAAGELASGLVMLPDADKVMEYHDTIQADSVEVPGTEELTSVSPIEIIPGVGKAPTSNKWT